MRRFNQGRSAKAGSSATAAAPLRDPGSIWNRRIRWSIRLRLGVRLPKLDVRRVAALRQIDANRIALAVDLVIFAKLVTQARGLDAHDGIDVGVKRLGTIEDLQSDVVALQPLAAPSESFIDDVL